MNLPFDPSHQEMQTALDLRAVYKTVDVESIYCLSSGPFFCALASWEGDEEQEEEEEHIHSVRVNQYGAGKSTFTQHGGSVVSTVASQQEGPGFESRSSWSFQVRSVWSLHVLLVPAWVYSGYSGFPHHQDMHRSLVWM